MVFNTETKITGIIGNPLKQSLSPLMHNLTFQQMNLNYVYLPFGIEPARLQEVSQAMRVLNIKGLNVTIPFKERIIPFIDNLSAEARICGAVNVVKNEDGRLTGYNTDGRGFIAGLAEKGISVRGRALFIGAGGAARSVACALAQNGITHIDFLDLDVDRATAMAIFLENLNCTAAGYIMNEHNFQELSSQADFIINASPLGMFPRIEAAPVANLDAVGKDCVLCDLIYNPCQTRFLLMGEKKGLRTISGASMFIHQGAFTLEIWTGLKPPVDFMREVVFNALARAGFYPG